ncbi:alkaline phosphatase family protein [Microbacterium sp. NPDC057659]|uniref:alkaline phosphatase family protein n=1 Tax=Microbacterium sp. NPDC057659 TaxID=3346198 RepID=UPI003671B85E
MSEPAGPRSSHVLVVGWDGVRDDERRGAATPYLDALGGRGFLVPVQVHEKDPTISGPVWSTMATGVHSDRHGVVDNDFTPNRFAEHPDFLTVFRNARPSATVFAAGEWAPLFTTMSGGPLFAGGHRPPVGQLDSLEGIAAIDEAVCGRAAQELLAADHAIVFAYFVLPDAVGHAEGVTPRYRTAIETCDSQLGVLRAAIDARPGRADEDWTIIVLTDHGHRDEGHHGGDTDAERIAWIGAEGPGITAASGVGVDHADVFAQVLSAVEVAYDADRVDGRPFGA